MRSVSEAIPVRFFALVTRARGILPRITCVLSPASRPSLSAMVITSRSFVERGAFKRPLCPRRDLTWRFMEQVLLVAQNNINCSTHDQDIVPRIWGVLAFAAKEFRHLLPELLGLVVENHGFHLEAELRHLFVACDPAFQVLHLLVFCPIVELTKDASV